MAICMAALALLLAVIALSRSPRNADEGGGQSLPQVDISADSATRHAAVATAKSADEDEITAAISAAIACMLAEEASRPVEAVMDEQPVTLAAAETVPRKAAARLRQGEAAWKRVSREEQVYSRL